MTRQEATDIVTAIGLGMREVLRPYQCSKEGGWHALMMLVDPDGNMHALAAHTLTPRQCVHGLQQVAAQSCVEESWQDLPEKQ